MTETIDPNDPATKALLRQASLDPEYWFCNYAKIRGKDGQILDSPKPNILQEKAFAYYRKCQAEGRPCLIMILKPRQKGASTWAEAMAYHHMRRNKGLNGLIMGDVSATSDKVFQMYKRYAQLDVFNWEDGKPNIADGKDLTENIELGNGSTFSQETAGSTNAGRSGTVQVLHLDEAAFFQKATNKDPTTAVLGSFAKELPVSLGIATSTANGATGWFYNTWNGKNAWHKIFAAWFEFDDSQTAFRTPEERHEFEASLTQDEIEEQKIYGVTLEQLNWRRNVITTDYEGDVAKFRQEFPSNDQECFMLSSSPRFDVGALKNMDGFARSNDNRERGNVVIQGQKSSIFIPDTKGDVARWEEPRIGCRYVVAVDTCTGEDQQTSGMSADRDWHDAQVWRAGYADAGGEYRRPALVMRHKSQVDTDILGETVAAMSIYYGSCLVVPEVNGMAGIHIVKQILKYRVPMFRRKPHTSTTKIKTEEENLSAYGWLTDRLTKKWIIDHLAPLVRKEELDIRDPEVIDQLKTFILTASGSAEALSGKKDDAVLAAAIAVYNIGSATEFRMNRMSISSLMQQSPDGFRSMIHATDRR